MRVVLLGVFAFGAIGTLGAAACSGEIVGDDDGAPVTLAFTSPIPASSHVRDQVEPQFGWRAARVAVALEVTGSPASIDLAAGEIAVAQLDPASPTADVLLIEPGTVTLTATARDAGGAALATATVDVAVVEPDIADCHGWLDLYGVDYTLGPANPGPPDPVTVTTPINGVPYRYTSNTNPRATFFMDCSLARSLLEAAPYFRERGVVEVADIGVYNYRCIGGGTPPDCPNGISQHAYAKAIDLAGFEFADGTIYTVNDDWVIDPSSEPTCTAATEDDKDAFLHDLICDLKQHSVWNIVLTPNYNADHRNHFHVDLTTGADFIRGRTPIDQGDNDW